MSLRIGLATCNRAILHPTSSRTFISSAVLQKPHVSKRRELSKKEKEVKAKRRALLVPKHVYWEERLALPEAISVLRAVEVARPTNTIELTIKTAMGTGIPIPKGRINMPKHVDVKGAVKETVLVFAEGRAADEARAAGADIVGGAELIDAVLTNKHNPTTVLCTPALIRTITPKLGRLLGPRGLMPSERRGTVTEDFAGYMRRIKGSTEWRADKNGVIRLPIAKASFTPEEMAKNISYFLTMAKRATGNERDPAQKEDQKGAAPVNVIKRIILSSSQGPMVELRDQ